MQQNQRQIETLGPAERIIQNLTRYVDHCHHGRPGVVRQDRSFPWGATWQQATWRQQGGEKNVYLISKGKTKRRVEVKLGRLNDETNEIFDLNARVVGRWQPPGLFPEVVSYIYSEIADVWKTDNEFAAKWASWAFDNESMRDLKVILAAFMLVQNRYGELVDVNLLDEDYRAVGEAMCLTRKKEKIFDPKMLLRVGQVLALPQVAEINRKLGFGVSEKRPLLGRYPKMIERWLQHIDQNPKVFETLIQNGFRRMIMKLALCVGYKGSPKFFETLRWKQKQSKLGHRTVAIGTAVKAAESWDGLSEIQICKRIVKEKPNWKLIAGRLPAEIGITRAIVSAAIESRVLSDKDLIIITPTLEELCLLNVPEIKKRWAIAMDRAKDQRAVNIAKNVKSEETKKKLEQAADKAAAKIVDEVVKDFRVYVIVDKSGSMEPALQQAKEYLTKFVGVFPLDRLHVAAFNTIGREIKIRDRSQTAVEQAFRGHRAGGGTNYASGVNCLLSRYKLEPNEDALFIFVGDQVDPGYKALVRVFTSYKIKPAAFGLISVQTSHSRQYPEYRAVMQAAAELKIPCFEIDKGIFEDPYAVPRTIKNIIAATPVGASETLQSNKSTNRKGLIQAILETPLLQKPAWAL